ncbi:hypothetical protein [Dolichospermum sp. UHCC 0259]|uniref:hypothetical protein n=1 Tax=Dolichospermum sp. UHCC 0259 TaxID=2590010 RepID=UPI001446C946|nr:hypothetical protein [Dolichospermum sp. UHCC 0259]
MLKTYIVQLSQEERQTLQDLVSKCKAAAYNIKHLLNNDYPDRTPQPFHICMKA